MKTVGFATALIPAIEAAAEVLSRHSNESLMLTEELTLDKMAKIRGFLNKFLSFYEVKKTEDSAQSRISKAISKLVPRSSSWLNRKHKIAVLKSANTRAKNTKKD